MASMADTEHLSSEKPSKPDSNNGPFLGESLIVSLQNESLT